TVEGIAGVELSTDYGNIELHILGLFIQPEYFAEVEALVKELDKRKMESNVRLAENLQKGGYDISFEELLKDSPSGYINRAHFAMELVRKGYVKTREEAFDTLLSKEGGFYEEPKKLPVFETIAFLKKIGGVAVLAHPFLSLTEQELRIFLPKAKEYGLDGMETVYSTYDEGTTLLAKRIAREYNIKESGGSDFHGGNKPDIMLGSGRGSLFIPDCFVKNLKESIKLGS
ncbi:MAG: hypothetical protein IJW96_01860, partial [Clostridia bacterium]|nr:hypothetical protein [Clostridia bacterium]